MGPAAASGGSGATPPRHDPSDMIRAELTRATVTTRTMTPSEASPRNGPRKVFALTGGGHREVRRLTSSHTGLMFWFIRKRFVGSYFFLSSTSRSYVAP